MTTQTRNGALEQVRTALREEFAGWPALPDLLAHLDEALAAERRATVEKVRVALKGRGFSPISEADMEWIGWRLDEVAE